MTTSHVTSKDFSCQTSILSLSESSPVSSPSNSIGVSGNGRAEGISGLGAVVVDASGTVPVDDNYLFGARKVSEKGGSVSPLLIEYETPPKHPCVLTPVDIDTLKLSLYGVFEYSVLEELESFKQQAILFDGDFPCQGRFNGWSIKAYGSSSAGMSYILYRGDVRVMVGKGSGKKAANFSVSVGSVSCHDYDLLLLTAGIYELFCFTVEKEIISRGDLCRDAAHDLSEIKGHILNTKNWYWNRKVKVAHYHDGDTFTGFQFGKGKIVVRGYDKGYQLLDEGNCRKIDFYQNYLNVDFPETKVWRIEGQMRREYFRSIGVNTLKDFLERKDEIWSYLVSEWLFLSENEVFRSSGNSSAKGTKMHESWAVYLCEAEPIKRCAPERISSGTDRVFRQGIGCIMSYAMKEFGDVDLPSLFYNMIDYVEFFLEQQLKLFFDSPFSGRNKYDRRLLNYVNSIGGFEPVPF